MYSGPPGERGRRIALFVGNLAVGGVARVALEFAREFQKRGFVVDLVTARADGKMRELVPSGVQVVDLRTGRLFHSTFALASYFKQSRPVAVVALTDLANVVAVVARAISGANFLSGDKLPYGIK